jgi:hypothetical protein
MEVRRDEFPVVVQAYETDTRHEVFVAEQVVNNQLEIDQFTARYTGKLIKARKMTDVEYKQQPEDRAHKRKGNSAVTAFLIILALLVVLAVVGFATGWIQDNLGIELP